MKLAVIFEVPDDRAEAYADAAARMIRHHQFSEGIGVKHWSFDLEMRPVGAALIDPTMDLATAVDLVRRALED